MNYLHAQNFGIEYSILGSEDPADLERSISDQTNGLSY